MISFSRTLAAAGLAVILVVPATRMAAAGAFDDLLGSHQQDSPAALAYAPAAAPRAAIAPPQRRPATSSVMPQVPAAGTLSHAPSSASAAVTYCVRLCDGRYFPLQRAPGATPIQMCNAFCPAAQTKVFTGTEIDHAAASDGARYADLDNAFVYREKIVPGCTCNGHGTSGLAPVEISKDTTLRAGDIVAGANGLQRFNGSHAQLRRGAGFSPVRVGDLAVAPPRVIASGAAPSATTGVASDVPTGVAASVASTR